MNICVLSGSPKEDYSITLQYVHYLAKKFPDCHFDVVHVGRQIHSLEKDCSQVLQRIAAADMLLFCYPVYTFIVPYQLYRFIEILKEATPCLSGKLAVQISTSKHFYDTTAHAFIEENCQDLGLRYLGGLSADMEDLLCERGRQELLNFWKLTLWRAETGNCETPCRVSGSTEPARYTRQFPDVPHPFGSDREVVIVANLAAGDDDLRAMIADFQAILPYRSRVVNVQELPFKGGCLGCFHCASDGACIYTDGFDSFLRSEIQTAAATVYAFRIRDHAMGSRMKLYDDRQFCNGHRTMSMGKPVGYLVLGNYLEERNLQTIIKGRADVGRNFLAGVATDAPGVKQLAQSLAFTLENNITMPQTFLGVGGMKIFRDLIYTMQGLMRADHRFYAQNHLYDFPQNHKGTILKMKLVGLLMNTPAIRKKMGNKMNEGMIAPYRAVIDKA